MTVYRNAQFGMSAPETYGTAATIDRLMPYIGDLDFDWEPNDQMSEVIEPGAVANASASYRPTESGTGTYNAEMKAKGFGRILKGAFGNGVSTLVSGGVYQQNFTLNDTSTVFDAFTMQAVRKLVDGTDDVHTFIGTAIKSVEFSMDNAGVLKVAFELLARAMSTAIAKASLTAITANRFTFAGFTFNTGTLTEPTTTVLGSCATALVGIRSWSLKVENNLVEDDYRANGAGLMSQPSVLQRTITGSIEARNTAQIQAFRTNWRNNSTIPLDARFTTGTDVASFIVPQARITGKITPNMDGNMPTVTIPFEGLGGAATQPLFCSLRTTDTAL